MTEAKIEEPTEEPFVTTALAATVIPLPTWTDAASVTSYITSLIGIAVTVLTLLHPGYTEPAVVQAAVPTVGLIVAGVAQLVNVLTHRSAQKAAIVAQYAAFGYH